MRRVLAVGFTVGLLVLAAACGDGETAAGSTTTVTSSLAPATTAPPATTAVQTTTPAPTTAPVPATTRAPTTTAGVPAEDWSENDLVYLSRRSDGATLTLDIHVPAEPDGAPIVIGAARSTVDGLLAEGIIVVIFDDDDDSLGEGPSGPEEIVSDPAFTRADAERFACAIRFARARASELGSVDPIVALTGVSAGGGLAAHVALFGATFDEGWDQFASSGGPPRQFDCEVTGGSTHVDAVVGMAGTYDLHVPIFDGMYGRAYQQEHNPDLQHFLAGAIGANPDLKIRLLHGTYDDIPVEFAAEFAALLEDAGYDVQLTTFAGGHVHAPTALFLATVMEVLGT